VKTLVKGKRVSGYLEKDGDVLMLENDQGTRVSVLNTDKLPTDASDWLKEKAMGKFIKVHIAVSETTYRCEIEIRKEDK
jgi:hypothetical protein